jgi:hypothetical protein
MPGYFLMNTVASLEAVTLTCQAVMTANGRVISIIPVPEGYAVAIAAHDDGHADDIRQAVDAELRTLQRSLSQRSLHLGDSVSAAPDADHVASGF